MSKEKLALYGGKPAFDATSLKKFTSIGAEERAAANRVFDQGGVLSDYYGNWSSRFYGGNYVKEIEKVWSSYLKVKHTVSVNSATSGLNAAIAAVGIEPGDEVIVTPYSMCASATCALVYQGIPVFADVEKKSFGLDPADIEKKITKRTKAIVVVHLFGIPADMDGIMALARKYKLKVIEDCAQAPGALYKGKPVGTIGDIGVFSLNCHKTIQTGEGGLCTTNDARLALRLQLVRNHGENVVSQMTAEEREKLLGDEIDNVFGHNYRMTELEAAIGIEQIKKLDSLNEPRIKNSKLFQELVSKSKAVITPVIEPGSKAVYYVYPVLYNEAAYDVPRNLFAKALQAEGVPLSEGYVKPIYWLQIFQRQTAFGNQKAPFHLIDKNSHISYAKGSCKTVEQLHEKEMLVIPYFQHDLSEQQIRDMAGAFLKVEANIDQLKSGAGAVS